MLDVNQEIQNCRANPRAVLIDLRNPEDFVRAHVPGSINVRPEELRNEIRRIATFNTPIYLVCYTGVRSKQAEIMLKDRGYTGAHSAGGLLEYTGELAGSETSIQPPELPPAPEEEKTGGRRRKTASAPRGPQTGTGEGGAEQTGRGRGKKGAAAPEAEKRRRGEAPGAKPRRGRKAKPLPTLREMRYARGLTQADLAKILGVSTSGVAAYEAGRANPSEKVMAQIKRFFGTEVRPIDKPLPGAPYRPKGRPKKEQDATPLPEE